MPDIYYLDSGTDDREERIEEDLLREALSVRIPLMVHLPPGTRDLPGAGSVVFGRVPPKVAWRQNFAWPKPDDVILAYWEDPTFLKHVGRRFEVLDWNDACDLVDEIHASGRRAFVKATDDKLLAEPVAAGKKLLDHVEELAFSFIDRGPCLMIQELADMRHEYRILVVNGIPVTGAGRILDATPLDNEAPFDPKTVATPDGQVERDSERTDRYRRFALDFTAQCSLRNYSLDLCEIDGRIAVVELNPMQPGRLGLFAIDIDLFADAVLDLYPHRLKVKDAKDFVPKP